jgi:hypothetical protein
MWLGSYEGLVADFCERSHELLGSMTAELH